MTRAYVPSAMQGAYRSAATLHGGRCSSSDNHLDNMPHKTRLASSVVILRLHLKLVYIISQGNWCCCCRAA